MCVTLCYLYANMYFSYVGLVLGGSQMLNGTNFVCVVHPTNSALLWWGILICKYVCVESLNPNSQKVSGELCLLVVGHTE